MTDRTHMTSALRPGDFVQVKTPDEILGTLDQDGTINRLPFMPEMIEHCGRTFRVSRRVVTTCCTATSGPRAFADDDVFLLDELRCSGAAHDGCQKACMIFWRAAWLRKVEAQASTPSPDRGSSERLRTRLKTSQGPNVYFCQASELLNATHVLSWPQRFRRCLLEITGGNYGPLEMALRLYTFTFWRIRRALLGQYPRGSHGATPRGTLNLHAGDLVEIKPLNEVMKTLDEGGNNRGLRFSPDMRLACGSRKRVASRIDRIIVDGTGVMRKLRDTVRLDDSVCGCPHLTFGGCSRGEIMYWREIWLEREGSSPEPGSQAGA
jgi:hypothetical protein